MIQPLSKDKGYRLDEMNIWVPSDLMSQADAKEIMHTTKVFMNSSNSKTYLNICQDSMLGGYMLTKEKRLIPRELFFDTCCKYDLSYILHKLDYIHSTLSKEDGLNWKIGDSYIDEYLNSYTLISMLVPDTFEYTKDDVIFHKGIMRSGILTSKTCGSEHGTIPHYIYLNYGNQEAINFISHFSFICDFYIMHRGFSVGISDCMTNVGLNGLKSDGVKILNSKDKAFFHKKNKNEIENKEEEVAKIEMDKCFIKALEIRDIIKNDDDIINKAKMMMALGDAISIGKTLAKKNLNSNNSFVNMITSGSKGNYTNITQITGLVGLQCVAGNMLPKSFGAPITKYEDDNKSLYIKDEKNFSGGRRCLPHFNDYTDIKSSSIADLQEAKMIFLSQGFVENNYIKGLTPSEFFFHMAGARDGLIDTACKTATVGYIERKMVKMMEDVKIQYNGLVMNNEQIIQFTYGDDNLSPEQLIRVNNSYSFIDVENLAEELNNEYEIENE